MFKSPYIPNTEKDRSAMLQDIGLNEIGDLFADIPDDVKLKRKLNLDKPKSEAEVTEILENLSKENKNTEDLVCFLGAGAYDHLIPSVIKHVISRSEFYTAYTPYQSEISQGTLQTIFEYQTMISDLTGMDVSNASLYDGPTSCAEAARIAVETTKRKKILVSKTVHPETRKVLETYMRFEGVTVVEIDDADGATDTDKIKAQLDGDTAAVIIQNPNFFGIVEDLFEIEKAVHANKSLLIMSVEPISLSILKTPGEYGADIAVGEGQPLGNRLNFGGPYFGFMAVTKKLMRKMPGRIVGETTDLDGKRSYVLTLQAREQHIRRQKATSNICSNQALNALSAAVYLAVMGKGGLKEVAKQCVDKSHYAFDRITRSGKFKPVFNKPFFMEFAVKSNLPTDKVTQELLKQNILAGYDLERDYPELSGSILICVTEKRTKQEIERLAGLMEELS